MRILQICNKPPLPPIDGGCLAMHQITDGLLKNNHSVKVVTISTPKHPYKKEYYTNNYLETTALVHQYIDTTPAFADAVFAVFKNESYNISRFYSKKLEAKLELILKENKFDVIHLESIYTTPYIPVIRKNSNAKIVLRTHNVEHKIWEELYQNTSNYLKKYYLKYLSKKLKKSEIAALNAVDGIAAISPNDLEYFQSVSGTKSTYIPFGIDVSEFKQQKNTKLNALFFLGAFDWLPNKNGINWFVNNVFPEIAKHYPETKLYIAGKSLKKNINIYNNKNIVTEGEVESSVEFMKKHDVLVVPLLEGSGIRIKILEAMSLKKPVIATTKAADGLNVINKENILMADTPQDFINAVTYLNNTGNYDKIAENGFQFVKNNYSSQAAINKLILFYKNITEG
jgi:polysaccharide biosynthesis protein PslH